MGGRGGAGVRGRGDGLEFAARQNREEALATRRAAIRGDAGELKEPPVPDLHLISWEPMEVKIATAAAMRGQ